MMFQSSSSPKAGCNGRPRSCTCSSQGFNPHPARRPDATDHYSAEKAPCALFQSSSSPKAGCNGYDDEGNAYIDNLVSILIQPEGRMQLRYAPVCQPFDNVSILIQPEGRMQLSGVTPHRDAAERVSILIQPEGRMQLQARVGRVLRQDVSILIQPEGRMQRSDDKAFTIPAQFQSSSSPKAGCNSLVQICTGGARTLLECHLSLICLSRSSSVDSVSKPLMPQRELLQ